MCERRDVSFNKTFNMIFKMASGQGSHWLIESTMLLSSIHRCISRPYQISADFILNIFTLLTLTLTQSVDSLFHSVNILCENEYFLISKYTVP